MFGLETIYFQLILIGVFVVATLVGYKLINKVPTLLHTPLMSGMNALSGVTVLGALTAAALIFRIGTPGAIAVSALLGMLAIALAMVNVVGGFMVTDRMLGMIAKNKAKGQEIIYAVSLATCRPALWRGPGAGAGCAPGIEPAGARRPDGARRGRRGAGLLF